MANMMTVVVIRTMCNSSNTNKEFAAVPPSLRIDTAVA